MTDDVASEAQVSAEQLSLGRRLRQPRTIVSIVLPIGLLLLFARALPGFKLDLLPGYLLAANGLLLLAAFGVFYVGFPLRGQRAQTGPQFRFQLAPRGVIRVVMPVDGRGSPRRFVGRNR